MSHMRVPQLLRYLNLELTRISAEEVLVSMAAPLRENGDDSVPGMDSGVVAWWKLHSKWHAIGCDVSRRAFANLTNVLHCATRLRELGQLPTWQTTGSLIYGLHVEEYTEYGTYSGPQDDFQEDQPSTSGTSAQWWHVFGFSNMHEATLKEAETRYRQHARKAHPDLPTGSGDAMRIFNEAIEQARKHFARKEAS